MSENKTLFEGLYQIDWANIEHVYVIDSPDQIPRNIRDLLSEEDTIRDEARSFLFGDGLDAKYGLIRETTLFIIPFVLELLELEETPEKGTLLRDLSGFLSDPSGDAENKNRNPIAYMQGYVAVYALLEAKRSLFLDFLKHPDEEICIGAIEILGTLSTHAHMIVLELIAHYQVDARHAVRLSLLQALVRLLSTSENMRVDIYALHQDFFSSVIETQASTELRYHAACIAVEAYRLYRGFNSLSSHVRSVFVEMFWTIFQTSGFLPAQQILEKIILLPDAVDTLWQILDDPRFDPTDTMHLLKWLLKAEFEPVYVSRYGPHLIRGGKRESDTSVYQYLARNTPSLGRKTLLRIVNDDRFWQKPTNTFSFFLGLPDSRKELWASLHDNKIPP